MTRSMTLLLPTLLSAAASLRIVSHEIARRDVLRLAAVSAGAKTASNALVAPALAAEDAPVKLSRKQIESKLSKIPVIALVNEEDAPFFTNGRTGYFYLDPTEALLELRVLQKTSPEARLKVVTLPEVYFPFVRGEQSDLGGDLRLRPSRRQVVQANRALQSNVKQGSFMPTVLDEAKGQVPIFYSERVAFGDAGGQTFPFFLVKEDLDAAFEQLVSDGAIPDVKPGSTNGQGIPIGLVRVATLDGLVDQMSSGSVDLTQAVVVGSRQALNMVRQLAQEGQLK